MHGRSASLSSARRRRNGVRMTSINSSPARPTVAVRSDHQAQPATQIADADAIDLLHRMVATPSLSRQEQAVAAVIRDWALAQGLRGEVDDTGNAVVSFGDPSAEHLIVCLGHMDTFPGMPRADREWNPLRTRQRRCERAAGGVCGGGGTGSVAEQRARHGGRRSGRRMPDLARRDRPYPGACGQMRASSASPAVPPV